MTAIALERLGALGVVPIALPLEATHDPTIKHIRILVSSNIDTAKRIIFVAPDSESSGMGIHSFRHMVDSNIGNGSMETLVKRAISNGYDAVVIANPASIYWDTSTSAAITNASWKARELSSKSASSGAILDSREYVITGHENPEGHIFSVLCYLKTRIKMDAEVDFVATGYTAFALLQGLSRKYSEWQTHLHAGVLAESSHSIDDFSSPGLREFVRKRCRNYILHADPLGTYLEPNLQTAVATFSSGESSSASEVVPAVLNQIFEYFKKARELDVKAKDRAFEKPEGVEEEAEEEELNPTIPIMMGEDFGSAHEEWMEALQKLNLGKEVPGWSVDGAEEVERLKQRADERELVIEEWKARARAEGKDVHVYEET